MEVDLKSPCFSAFGLHPTRAESFFFFFFFFFFQWRYSPGWASASFKNFLHPFRFRAATVQFLHPSFATSSFTPSSHRNLGLPLGRFLPGSLRRTLLAKSSSSWRMTCPAHLSLLSLQNFTMSFTSYNCQMLHYFHISSLSQTIWQPCQFVCLIL